MTAVEELEQEAYDQTVPVDYVKFKVTISTVFI